MEDKNLRVGMQIKIRDDIEDGEFGITNAAEYAGQVVTIDRVFNNGTFYIEEDYHRWYWRRDLCSEIDVDDDIAPPLVDSIFENLLSTF